MDIGSEELLDSRPFTANDVWCELADGLGDFLAVAEAGGMPSGFSPESGDHDCARARRGTSRQGDEAVQDDEEAHQASSGQATLGPRPRKEYLMGLAAYT